MHDTFNPFVVHMKPTIDLIMLTNKKQGDVMGNDGKHKEIYNKIRSWPGYLLKRERE